jgi:mRNA interferase MazF
MISFRVDDEEVMRTQQWAKELGVDRSELLRGDIWFTSTAGGGRPVLVLTRDPLADRISAVAVAALTRTTRGLASELELTVTDDGDPSDCVVNFDNIHTLRRDSLRRHMPRCRHAAWPRRVSDFAMPPVAEDRGRPTHTSGAHLPLERGPIRLSVRSLGQLTASVSLSRRALWRPAISSSGREQVARHGERGALQVATIQRPNRTR